MKVQVILGSIRPGRVSERVAKWIMNELEGTKSLEAELVDLKDFTLPLFDEPISPQFNSNRKPEGVVKEWLDKLAEADAYIIVSPEYNRSMPGVVKNALDYVDYQMVNKPVGLVAHGVTGGAQAIANYRMTLSQLKTITLSDAVYLTGATRLINDDGVMDEEVTSSPYGPHTELKAILDTLQQQAAPAV